MIRYLKSGQTAEAKAEKQAEVRKTVEAILAGYRPHGEQAVREYSEKFDHWSPAQFPADRAARSRTACEQCPSRSIA